MRTIITLAIVVACTATARGQGRTDVVTLANGDRITGEIMEVARGRLALKTDDAGTIDIEWVKIIRLEATREFELITSDGRHLLGSLGHADNERFLLIVGSDGSASLPIPEVTNIVPIGAGFWKKVDGSIDAGFSYTRSSGVTQTTLNTDTIYRKPAFSLEVTASATVTQVADDDERDDRADLDISYMRYRWRRWFLAGGGRFETNESLGLALRSQFSGLGGIRLVNTNRAQFTVSGGLSVNDEEGVDTESTQNLEGVLAVKGSFFSYDRPKTNLDLSFQYYPSFSDWGRQRLQLDSAARRELVKDFFVSLNLFDTFDSAPPSPDAARNDVGIVASLGWSY